MKTVNLVELLQELKISGESLNIEISREGLQFITVNYEIEKNVNDVKISIQQAKSFCENAYNECPYNDDHQLTKRIGNAIEYLGDIIAQLPLHEKLPVPMKEYKSIGRMEEINEYFDELKRSSI